MDNGAEDMPMDIPMLLRQVSLDHREGVLDADEKMMIKLALTDGSLDDQEAAIALWTTKADAYAQRVMLRQQVDHAAVDEERLELADQLLADVENLSARHDQHLQDSNLDAHLALQRKLAERKKKHGKEKISQQVDGKQKGFDVIDDMDDDLVMEMPQLLRQISELANESIISRTERGTLKEQLLSGKLSEQRAAREAIAEHMLNVDDELEVPQRPELDRQISLYENEPIEEKKSLEKTIDSFEWLNMGQKGNPYIYMYPVCWQLVFQFLSLPNIVANVMVTCKSFNEYCDQRLFRALVVRDFKKKNYFIPQECPDWRLLFRDTVYKWETSSKKAGDGAFNIKVYARFYTGPTGYEARKSPAELETIKRKEWNKKKMLEMKKRKADALAKKKNNPKGRRSPPVRKVPRGHPDYVEKKKDEKYVPVEQKPTVLSIHPKMVRTWLPNYGARTFAMNGCFDGRHSQQTVYNLVASRITSACLLGFNGTLLVYGQTGSGKTYTMFGPGKWDQDMKTKASSVKANIEVAPMDYGIIPRTCSHILNVLKSERGTTFTLTIEYIEIYQDEVSELVPARSVTKIDEVFDLLIEGQKQKTIFATAMNERSSRAHTIFTISLKQQNYVRGKKKVLEARYHMVDLAGSERVKKSGVVGQRMEEAKHINKSLSALERVILRLSEESVKSQKPEGKKKKNKVKAHIPYRDSELTTLLEESLGGNAQTTMIVCARGKDSHTQETLSTLRFGERAGKIKNHVKQKDVVQELNEKIDASRRKIARIEQNFTYHELMEAEEMVRLQLEIDEEVVRNQRERNMRRARGERLGGNIDPRGILDQERPLVERLKIELNGRKAQFTKDQLRTLDRLTYFKSDLEKYQRKLQELD